MKIVHKYFTYRRNKMTKNPQVFIGGDGAARVSISPDKLKKKNRFSLNSIIDRLPKLCKDELCYEEMDDTFSMSSLDASTENGLNSVAYPVAPVEEENILVDKEGECCNIVMIIVKELPKIPSHHHTTLLPYNLVAKPVKEEIKKKEKATNPPEILSPTGIMQSRTTKRRSVSRSPQVKEHKKLSH